MKKIVVGMSGGVDSFVTALRLQREGYDVTGVVLGLWEPGGSPELEDLCRELDIPLIRYDGREVFRREVVEPFVKGYVSGTTPSPCCVCNSYVKWSLLLAVADELGIGYIATGHYVRQAEKDGYRYVRKGVDVNKDQSYFLWGLSQDILCRAVTPLGGLTKAEVKAYAAANGYERMAGKRESMGVCFLQGRDYREFISSRAGSGKCLQAGDILDREGQVIGQHDGILNYTVGQRRGLPLVGGQPLYVSRIDAVANTVIADVKSGLWADTIEVEGLKIVRREDLFAGDVEIRVRGLGLNPAGYVLVEETADDRVTVRLASPAWAVAPGQPVAFYRGELVVGGGMVKK